MPEAVPSLKRRPRRAWWLALLALAVALLHVWLINDIAVRLPEADAPPPPMEVAFVRELAPSLPPPPPTATPAPPAPPPPVARAPQPVAEAASAPEPEPEPEERVPEPPVAEDAPPPQDAAAVAQAASAASAPEDAASAPALPPDGAQLAQATPAPASAADTLAEASAASAPEPPAVADAASAVALSPDAAAAAPQDLPPAAVAAADPAASAPHQGWPPSTQLDYALSGWYRGEVHGSARVQWLLQDKHYQVHLEVVVGPTFAPLMRRRMSSDGDIGARGLLPRRYDEETRLGPMSPRRASVRFEPDAVVLSGGTRRVPQLGVQDSVSQFVQMTWLFTLRPALLQPGNVLELPLALPRRLDLWTYDVLGEERIETPVGALPAVHVKPRREPRAGDVMTVEAWFAPTLQYLPVRLLIRQSADVWVDLRLKRLPLQSR